MSLIRLHDITKQYDAKTVLRSVFFRLEAGDRVGLIGKNGAGKTTLLRLILGQEEPTQGEVQVDEKISIGYFSQFSELHGDQSIETILDSLFAEVHALDAELKEIEKTLAVERNTRTVDSLLRRQATLLERMHQIDGWHYRNRIDTVLTQLGFNQAHRTRPVEQLSGGWRNRAALAQILLQDPDVLLLDEPTNYLDVQGLTWLEQWLDKSKPVERIVTQIYDNLRVKDALCCVEGLGKAYDDQILFLDLTFELRRGHRVVVVGPNGCGKTSLLVFEEEGVIRPVEGNWTIWQASMQTG